MKTMLDEPLVLLSSRPMSPLLRTLEPVPRQRTLRRPAMRVLALLIISAVIAFVTLAP